MVGFIRSEGRLGPQQIESEIEIGRIGIGLWRQQLPRKTLAALLK
jgi:hypothetical protein